MEKQSEHLSDEVLAEARELNLDALRAKYIQERDKRVRVDGRDQYARVTGELSSFSRDPHANDDFHRTPVRRNVDVLVIGGGLAGLSVAARLRKAQIDDFLIVEKGAGFGGTWYWNRYPGLRCDTDACTYLPLLEETGYIPTEPWQEGSANSTTSASPSSVRDVRPSNAFLTWRRRRRICTSSSAHPPSWRNATTRRPIRNG